jgi:hypothetical protein
MLSLPLWRYVLTAVLRDRVIQLMIVLMLLGMSAALFLGNTAIIEKKAFTIAMAATILRMLSVLGLVTFISFFVRRAFESREIDYLLATPLTRHRLLLSFAAAFVTVAFILAAAMSAIIFVLQHNYNIGWLIWSLSVFVELGITAMIALFFSIALKSATVSVLSSLGYYSLARMLGAMIGIVTTKLDSNIYIHRLIDYIVKTIATVTPRFDLLAQSAWLVYHNDAGVALWILPVQFIVFCSLFFFAAAFDLRRSQF